MSTTHYSPTAEQPYEAPQLPDVTPVPAPAAVGPYQQQGIGRGGITPIGGIATVLDSTLRGYMQGRAQGDAIKIMRAKKQQDSLYALYNMASENLKNLHESGADPNSDEYKQAAMAAQASWDSIKQFWGQQLEPDGKKKSKGKKQGDGSSPLAGLTSQDPEEKARAMYQIISNPNIKAPIFYKLKTIDPNAQKAQETTNAAALAEAEVRKQKADLEKKQADLIAQPQSPERDKQLKDVQAQITALNPPRPKEPKEPTTKWEAAYQALVSDLAEKGKKPTVQDIIDLNDNLTPEAKLPSSPFAAKLQLRAKRLKSEGKELTEKDVDEVYKETKLDDPLAGLRDQLARMRLDDLQRQRANNLQKDVDAVARAHKDNIDRRIDRLNKDAEANAIDPTSDEYKQRMAKIEKDDYEGMLKIGRSAQTRYKRLGMDVDAPKPEPWDKSYLSDEERKKIFGDASQNPEEIPTLPKSVGGAKVDTSKENLGVPGGVVHPSKLPVAARAHLKEGHVTTFKNGTHWTLRNGKPLQVDEKGNPV